ncbi:MAG: chemotaxis protein CheW [Xanthomonadales bacterium]|nr:chemotaxis protein CheW [Gammaproteobacteria bacterium]NNE04260.1 chemotaxis protein CheW [Xanthomonadales bacterium]NNL95949.1 chemotaxis protein CheW [Xanthomonadales bacterium]
MAEENEEIRCLAAPIEGGSVLLPGSVIAEVGTFEELRPYKKSPLWLLGSTNWNDWSVPVVSLSLLGGIAKGDDALSGTRVLIIKSLNESAMAPYLGILINGVPSMIRVTAPMLTAPKHSAQFPCVFREITIDENQALIPDLDKLSEQIEAAIGEE